MGPRPLSLPLGQLGSTQACHCLMSGQARSCKEKVRRNLLTPRMGRWG